MNKDCPRCNGSGILGDYVLVNCVYCKGTGKILDITGLRCREEIEAKIAELEERYKKLPIKDCILSVWIAQVYTISALRWAAGQQGKMPIDRILPP
jgi:hypothetical protein